MKDARCKIIVPGFSCMKILRDYIDAFSQANIWLNLMLENFLIFQNIEKKALEEHNIYRKRDDSRFV